MKVVGTKKHHFHILKAINYPLCVLTFLVPILNSCRHHSSSIGNGTTLESIGCILVLYSATQLRKLMDDEKHFSLLLFLLRKNGRSEVHLGRRENSAISRDEPLLMNKITQTDCSKVFPTLELNDSSKLLG